MKLYRAMKLDVSGYKPKIGDTARELGVRIDVDIELVDNFLLPDDGGMSVSPNSSDNLPPHRKNKDNVWVIDSQNLEQFGLQYYENVKDKHGLIKPINKMTLLEFQAAINKTQTHWQLEKRG